MELKQNKKCGAVCRPGGLALTARMIKLCGFEKGDHIADIGCGSGTTMHYLKDKFDIKGVEIDVQKVRRAQLEGLCVHCASALEMPFADKEMNGLLFECSFSKMEQPSLVLTEAKRVLKPNGKIAFSDFYAKNEPYHFKDLLGRCDTQQMWHTLLDDAGFDVITTEDYSNLLPQMWAQLKEEQGGDEVYAKLGVTKEKLKQIKCGYCMIIAQKRG